MLFKEIIAVYSKNRTNTKTENKELLTVEAAGT
jgi:hypothetical protein